MMVVLGSLLVEINQNHPPCEKNTCPTSYEQLDVNSCVPSIGISFIKQTEFPNDPNDYLKNY